MGILREWMGDYPEDFFLPTMHAPLVSFLKDENILEDSSFFFLDTIQMSKVFSKQQDKRILMILFFESQRNALRDVPLMLTERNTFKGKEAKRSRRMNNKGKRIRKSEKKKPTNRRISALVFRFVCSLPGSPCAM